MTPVFDPEATRAHYSLRDHHFQEQHLSVDLHLDTCSWKTHTVRLSDQSLPPRKRHLCVDFHLDTEIGACVVAVKPAKADIGDHPGVQEPLWSVIVTLECL